MKKICAVGLFIVIFLLVGCGSNKSNESTEKTPANVKVEVTAAEAQAKLKKLSGGLTKDYDDMKELTYYRAPVGEDMRVIVEPYVVVDKDYYPTLIEHLQYFGSHVIKFDTLYIKSADKFSEFHYKDTFVVSYKSEAYGGVMSNEVYDALKSACESGYVRVRMEGNAGLEEKELSKKEIDGIKAVFAIYEYLSQIKVVN